MQISADPPSPYLILDIFILDKYKLVFTPLPLPKFGQKLIFLYRFCKDKFDISSLLFSLLPSLGRNYKMQVFSTLQLANAGVVFSKNFSFSSIQRGQISIRDPNSTTLAGTDTHFYFSPKDEPKFPFHLC